MKFKIKWIQKLKLKTVESLFYRQAKQYPNLTFYKGYRSPSSGKEKGVDVHLAVDIVRNVLSKSCKEIIIMTGDADFIYPIEIAKEYGIETGAIFLPNRFSLELAYKVDRSYVFNFLKKFKSERKLPRQLRILQKSPACEHTG